MPIFESILEPGIPTGVLATNTLIIPRFISFRSFMYVSLAATYFVAIYLHTSFV